MCQQSSSIKGNIPWHKKALEYVPAQKSQSFFAVAWEITSRISQSWRNTLCFRYFTEVACPMSVLTNRQWAPDKSQPAEAIYETSAPRTRLLKSATLQGQSSNHPPSLSLLLPIFFLYLTVETPKQSILTRPILSLEWRVPFVFFRWDATLSLEYLSCADLLHIPSLLVYDYNKSSNVPDARDIPLGLQSEYW